MSRNSKFVQHAIDIANDDSHGYSQTRRWGPDFDCSSLMYECAEYAGYPISRDNPRYTGSMIEDFSKVGYRVESFDGNLYDLDPGDILLNTANHTAVYIGNNQVVEASCSETGGIDGASGDQTGYEIHIGPVYNYPWTHVLIPPSENTSDNGASYQTVSKDVSEINLDAAITRIALACINGVFGNLPERRERIYAKVQDKVNQLLGA